MPTSASTWTDDDLLTGGDSTEFDDPFLVDGDVAIESAEEVSVLLSEFAQMAFRIPNAKGDFDVFSFEGRRHMREIYDSPARDILLICGRQVEKCVDVGSLVCLSNGRPIPAGEVQVGDRVLSTDGHPAHLGSGQVVWMSGVVRKPRLQIRTRGGHSLTCATTHPIWSWDRWVPAAELQVGSLVSARRRASPDKTPIPQTSHTLYKVLWTVASLGGAYSCGAWYEFQCPQPKLACGLEDSLQEMGFVKGVDYESSYVHGRSGKLFRVRKTIEPIASWVSPKQEVPAWVWDLPREYQRLLVALLWAHRGHVGGGRPEVVYWHTKHEKVASYLQSLMQGLGLRPLAFRDKAHNHGSYALSMNRRALFDFNSELLDRLRTEAPSAEEFLPDPLWQEIRQLAKSDRTLWQQMPRTRRFYFRHKEMELGDGLEVLKAMQMAGYDVQRLRYLKDHLSGQLVADRVTSIEVLPEGDCVDLQVEPGRSFVADGLLTHNSTFLGNMALSLCALHPGYRVLYVSPSGAQTQTFSNDRLRFPVETSPLLAPLARKQTQNVLLKVFTNQSQIVLRSAFLSADRARGQAAYLLLLDEFQDLLREHIPVIEPSTSHAPPHLRRHCYSGTPKSMDNNIEHYRSGFNSAGPMSTLGEWMVPCDRCGSKSGAGRYWQCLGEMNIDRKGLICDRCKQRIDPQHPEARWVHHRSEGQYESYRIPQLMVGWMQHPEKWAKLFDTFVTYPRAQFYNEVLGLSMDNADRPLLLEDIERCCVPDLSMTWRPRGAKEGVYLNDFLPRNWTSPVFMGIDWGLGTSSFTIITLGTYFRGKFTTIYAHRCTGQELDFEVQLQLIVDLITQFDVKKVGCDFGYGAAHNDRLIRLFGPQRIYAFQHLGKAKRKIQRDPGTGRIKLFRTLVMADIINAIKRRVLQFPRFAEFRMPYGQDFANITAEYSESQRLLTYDHSSKTTDDTFHANLYMFLASWPMIPRPDIIAPMQVTAQAQGPVLTLPQPFDQG